MCTQIVLLLVSSTLGISRVAVQQPDRASGQELPGVFIQLSEPAARVWPAIAKVYEEVQLQVNVQEPENALGRSAG